MKGQRLSLAFACALLALTLLAPTLNAQQAGPYPPSETGGPLYVDYPPPVTNDRGFVSQLISTTPPAPGQGGYNPATGGSYANLLSSQNFPAVQGMQVSTAYFNLKPCGLVPPHYHPRAAEVAIVVTGTVLFIFFDTEGNTHYMNVPQGSQVLLPPALPHIYQEYANAPATIISAFSEENPGTVLLAPALFAFPEGIVRSALGLPNAAATSGLNSSIPTGFTTVALDACTSTGAGHLG